MRVRAALDTWQVRVCEDATGDLVGVLPEVVADHERFGVGVADHGGHLRRREAPVDRTRDRPSLIQREEELDEVVGVLVEDRDTVAGLDAQPVNETGRELRARAVHLIEGALPALVPGDWEIRPPAGSPAE